MDKYIEQLKPIFEKVAEKIGQGAQYGWEIVLRQQISYGVVWTLVAIISLISLRKIWKMVQKTKKGHEYEWDEYGEGEIAVLISSTIILGGVFLVSMIFGVLYLMNPGYYALKFFIDLTK